MFWDCNHSCKNRALQKPSSCMPYVGELSGKWFHPDRAVFRKVETNRAAPIAKGCLQGRHVVGRWEQGRVCHSNASSGHSRHGLHIPDPPQSTCQPGSTRGLQTTRPQAPSERGTCSRLPGALSLTTHLRWGVLSPAFLPETCRLSPSLLPSAFLIFFATMTCFFWPSSWCFCWNRPILAPACAPTQQVYLYAETLPRRLQWEKEMDYLPAEVGRFAAVSKNADLAASA